MQGDEREDQALHSVTQQHERESVLCHGEKERRRERGEGTNLEILNEVVEHTETLRVLAILDIDEGTNLGSLKKISVPSIHSSSNPFPQETRVR